MTRGGRYLCTALVVVLTAVRGAHAGHSIIPIPEIITDPNEGTTIGLLPVVLFTDERDQIQYMLAPDFSYNKTRGFFPRFRLFGYPSREVHWSLVAGKSTTKDERYIAGFTDRALWDGRAFVIAQVLHEQDSTRRFFGFGNSTTESRESNYTGNDTVAYANPGVWLLPKLSLAYNMQVRRFSISQGQVSSFPFIKTEHPEIHGRGDQPGVYWSHRAILTFDSRDDIDIPSHGAYSSMYVEAADRALGSATSFVKFGGDWRDFVPVQMGRWHAVLAMHALIDYVSGGSDTPFWQQSSLGERQLRGFGSDRFVDFNRTAASIELRVPVYSHRLFGVNPTLEVTPFFDTGEVFHRVSDSPVSDLHVAYGLGFRAVVRPQIVAYVDVGYGYEGSAVFSGVGYPF
jgi:outer membrane protein assembly factor BamA